MKPLTPEGPFQQRHLTPPPRASEHSRPRIFQNISTPFTSTCVSEGSIRGSRATSTSTLHLQRSSPGKAEAAQGPRAGGWGINLLRHGSGAGSMIKHRGRDKQMRHREKRASKSFDASEFASVHSLQFSGAHVYPLNPCLSCKQAYEALTST